MPFFFPGKYPTWSEMWYARSSSARSRSMMADGDWRESEPRFAQETAAKLSHPLAEADRGADRAAINES